MPAEEAVGKPRQRDTDPRYKLLPSWFKDLDRDEDGQVALHEWRAQGKKLAEFRTFDLNDDGLITVDEVLRQVSQLFELKLENGQAKYHGAIEKPVDEKYRDKISFTIFIVKLENRKTYQIELVSKVFQSFLYLEDSDGNLLMEHSSRTIGDTSRLIHRATRTGAYRLVATSLGGFRTGAYQISVRVLGDFGAVSPQALPLWFTELDSDGDGQVALHEWRERGKKLAEFHEFDLNGDGFITVDEVVPRANTPLSLKFEKGQATYNSAIETAADERYRGKNCYKFFHIRLEKGKTYQFDHMSKAFDAYLYLEDPHGELLAEDDDGGGGLNSRIVHHATRPGTYRLVAASLGNSCFGAFSLSARVLGTFSAMPSQGLPPWFTDLDSDGDGQVALYEWRARGRKLVDFHRFDLNGDGFITAEEVHRQLKNPLALKLEKGQATHNGAIETVADEKYRGKNCYKSFHVRLEKGKTYQFDHMSKAFDAYLYLEDPDGKLLAENDDGGGGLNSRIVHHASRPGMYRLIAASLGNSRLGAFSLSARVLGSFDGAPTQRLPPWFTDLDSDGDGQVALHEWRARGGKLADFRELDLNDDGLITAEEVLRFLNR